jgi:hypothetical protein
MSSEPSKKSGLQEVGSYFFRKKDPSQPQNFNIRAMHTINKISILMFLIGVIMVIIKLNLR